jgi:ferredoxin
MSSDVNDPGRRRFFRDALDGLVKPLAAYLEGRLDVPAGRPFLRPPGAIEEAKFLDTCYRCGSCAGVCPVHAITLRQLAPAHPANSTPGIDPDVAACAVCEGIQCTQACPSGALRVLKGAYEIDMGLAVVAPVPCVRSRGESCTLCVDKCPIGAAAIRFHDEGPPRVSESGCVGCGMCQLFCPTHPKAIVVEPA